MSRITFDVYLNSGEENINTFGGVLHYPSSWSIEKIDLQNPKLAYWVEPPTVEDATGLRPEGSIPFSGIILGGVQNLIASGSKELLYSVDFNGDPEAALGGGVFFAEEEFYLNHPAALSASQGFFSFSSHPTDSYDQSNFSLDSLDISFSFEEDPLTGAPSLVLDSHRGDLASYVFAEKEGDFNFKNWIPVDSVQELKSSHSTVKLSVIDDEDVQHTLLLRSSPLRVASLVLVAVLFFCGIVYLFRAAFKILRFARYRERVINKQIKRHQDKSA